MKIEELKSFIESETPKLMKISRTPGLSISIIIDGEKAYMKAFGARDLESNSPATINTLYGFGSCTKSMTALAIMQLAEEGKISIEDPVEKYAPLKIGFKEYPIRIHHLLSHSSGIPSLNTAVISLRKATGVKEDYTPLSSMEDFYRYVNAIDSSFAIDRFKYYVVSVIYLMSEELLRPRDVAKIFGISVKTLWKWQRKGIIKAVRLPTGKLRYPKSEVERLWKQLKATESQ
jgi:predicted DNA-binding transcriptional regulator AlpA